MVDHLTWCLCDEGDGVLFPQPLYTGFSNDVPTRARGKLVPASFARDDGSINLDDVFDPEANLRCLERAYQKATQDGTKVRAVMITNPYNPLGKCYSLETIKAIASFCAKHDLHYLSDEIYAMTVFENAQYPQATPFTSILATDISKIIRPELVHVLYSAAKDFCANGLRLGMFWSKNAALRKAMISIS